MLTVVTTCTPDYSKPWIFPSLGMLSCRVVCLLDPADSRPLPRGVERAPYLTPGVAYQDGRFLGAVPNVADDDLICLTDADGIFQRDFSEEGVAVLSGCLGMNGFALGYNMYPGQRGAAEHEELRPNQPIERTAELLGLPVKALATVMVYNTGLMIARPTAWRQLRVRYAELFASRGRDLFQLHSWPQYFICLTLAMGFSVVELDYKTHSHGHFPLTAQHRIERRQLWYGEDLVLYAHAVPGVCF